MTAALAEMATAAGALAADQLAAAIGAAAPHLTPDAVATWAHAFATPACSSGIVGPRRVAMFIGQVCEESGGLSVLVENLDYTAERLCQVWPSHFPTLASAEPYAHQPEQLADCIYAGRLGNGPAGSGDGWRFRGEGPIELTGRGLISQFAAAFNMSPDQAAAWMLTPPGGAAAACWYWTLPAHPRSLLALSDTWDVAGVTRIINGGLINLNRREALCTAALRAVS